MSKPSFTHNALWLLGVVILILIFVTMSSFVRTREVDESETADWLVLLELGLCAAGGAVGCMIRKGSVGTAARLLLAYCAAVAVSALFSSYSTVVAGYWLLLTGTSLLLIGLVSSLPDEPTLRRLESIIFGVLTLMIFKDAMLDWFFLDPRDIEEMYRLGENTTSANGLAMTAAMAFCMSFLTTADEKRGMRWRYALRAVFLLVLLLTRSRVGLIGLAAAMAARLWFRSWSGETRSRILAAAIPCWIGSLVLVVFIAWIMRVQPVTATVDFLNRSEDSETLRSVTGRAEIWNNAIARIFDDAPSVAFGHGYGVSRLVLNENNLSTTFFAYHAHNTLLESLLGTGLFGTLPLLLLVGYSSRWVFRFSRLRQSFSLDLMLRAISIITLIISAAFTESAIANKVSSISILFLFYVLVLDRRFTVPTEDLSSNKSYVVITR